MCKKIEALLSRSSTFIRPSPLFSHRAELVVLALNTYGHTRTQHNHTNMSQPLHRHTHIHSCTYTYQRTIHNHILVYTHAYIHTHIHILTPTYMSTHWYIPTAKSVNYNTSVIGVTIPGAVDAYPYNLYLTLLMPTRITCIWRC